MDFRQCGMFATSHPVSCSISPFEGFNIDEAKPK
jgi:hypothetical protein